MRNATILEGCIQNPQFSARKHGVVFLGRANATQYTRGRAQNDNSNGQSRGDGLGGHAERRCCATATMALNFGGVRKAGCALATKCHYMSEIVDTREGEVEIYLRPSN